MGEQRRPTTTILWVLTGCVAFVVVGFWVTRPRSDAEEWSPERDGVEVVRTHDTFEDAWKQVWESRESSRKSDATDVVRPAKPARRTAKTEKTSTDRSLEHQEKKATRIADRTARDAVVGASGLVASEESKNGSTDSTGSEGESSQIDDTRAELAAVDTSLISSGESSTGLTSTEIVRPAARAASPAKDVDEEIAALSRPQETRVVTLRLSGSVGGKQLDPKDGYAWGRLSYFFQRERKPPYFLVFPGGGVSGVMGPPASSGRLPGERKTVRGLPSMRPRGRLGAPLFVINLTAQVESGGTMRFYGRGLAQKYLCRLNAQVVYVGGETPKVVDSFTVTENATAVQGRVATGPPGGAIYQAAIEKLITRLRATTYFR